MSEAKATAIIDLPVSDAWEILKDFSIAHKYVPGVINTEIVTAEKSGVGASRKVFQSFNRSLDETIVEWNEGAGFKIRLHKGAKDAPFKGAYFRYEIKATGDQQTELTTTMGYTPPMGGLGTLMDKLFLNAIITGVITDVALSMKHFYETKQPTSKADLKRLKARLA